MLYNIRRDSALESLFFRVHNNDQQQRIQSCRVVGGSDKYISSRLDMEKELGRDGWCQLRFELASS